MRHIPKNKSLGPDHWHPNEVKFLPDLVKGKLAEIMHQAEKEGKWPDNLRYSTVTLTPKAKAIHDVS